MAPRRRRSRRARSRRVPKGPAFTFLLLVVLAVALAALAAEAWEERARDGPSEPASLPPANGTLRLHYVDVGQGDAAIWELPDGSLVVYDCGPAALDPESNPVVRYLRDRLGRAPGSPVAALVASHGHLDHVGGCDEVFDVFRVERVYDAWYEGDDAPESYKRFQREVLEEGAVVHTLAPTDAFEGEQPLGAESLLPAAARDMGVRAEVLWPQRAASDWDSIANHGIVVRLAFGETSACFQGDIEAREEAALATSGRDVSCDVYLMGHHGSRHASTTGWLTAMDPQVAVVSFGDNPYGHPTPEALCRVQESGAAVYATKRLGDVVVTLDGARVAVAPDAPETTDYCAAGAKYG